MTRRASRKKAVSSKLVSPPAPTDNPSTLASTREFINLNTAYKKLCFANYTFPHQNLLNSLKYGEIVMSIDSLGRSNDRLELKPFQLPLEQFADISLISLYS